MWTSTPVDRVDHDDRGVGDAQRRDRVGDEARLARGVDQVDLAAVVLEGRRREASIDISRSCSSGSWSETVVPSATVPSRFDRPGLEQHRLVQARLAAAPVPDQGDIANPVCGLMRHACERYTGGPNQSCCSCDFSRITALVCSCETRDSVTPRTSPISRRVRFS